MLLSELLKNSSVYNQFTSDLDINFITKDSREVSKGALFCAVRGNSDNGELYIEDAVRQGASVILTENEPAKEIDVPCLKSNVVRKDSSIIAKNFYNNAVDNLEMFAVTGTNGKTSTVFALAHILKNLKLKTSYLSTIDMQIGSRAQSSEATTPDSFKLHNYFSKMVSDGSKACVMEVSSHGIDQERIFGINFDVKILTNVTSDHLDYHHSISDYQNVKQKFLTDLNSKRVVNLNDPMGSKIATSEEDVFTYAIENTIANLCGFDLMLERGGMSFKLKFYDQVRMVFISDINALFMVENILAAISGALVKDFDLDDILNALKGLKFPKGRFTKIDNVYDMNVFIDYAHTSDALESVLTAARKINGKHLIVVFGCGGDRDSTKRKEMGRIAELKCDKIYLTSDNSRSEDSLEIINEIKSGISKDKDVFFIEDRRDAICKAITDAGAGDTIVIAGKGHEEFQEIKGVKYRFSDFEVVDEALSVKGGLCGCKF